MGWKDGKRPEQYLFTITQDFSKDWQALKLRAKQDNRNISDVLRGFPTRLLGYDRMLYSIITTFHLMDAGGNLLLSLLPLGNCFRQQDALYVPKQTGVSS